MKNTAAYILSLSLVILAGAIIYLVLELRQVRASLPAVTSTIENSTKEFEKVVPTFEKFVDLIPQFINEIKTTRKQLPQYFDRTEDLLSKGKEFGRDSSSGVVTGLVQGVVTAPFNLIGGIFSRGKEKLTKTDQGLIERSAEAALKKKKKGVVETWESPNSSHSGSAEVLSIDKKNKCATLKVTLQKNRKVISTKNVNVCEDSKGEWHLKK